jgi:pyridoxal phosphate enzyme (YggS family)
VPDLLKKKAAVPGDARWHFIGHLQTNKAKQALAADLLHTVDSERLGAILSRHAEDRGSRARVLIEVNVGEEPQKAGVAPSGAEALLRALLGLPGLSVVGLMCIPPAEAAEPGFAHLRELRDRLVRDTGVPLDELSMGMSSDYESAVAAGATLVRVGTAIFGERG